LSVIRSETDLALQTEALDERLRSGLISVKDTTDRGAALTRQLLAFARQQPVAVSMVEPDAVVAELDRMLRRLIGPGVRLQVDAGAAGRQVGVDRSQLEQVLTNLVVNARDAMPDGGRLTIATRHASVRAGAELLGLDPGEWVIISVSDTGTGIPEEQRTRIFEPFFTTKEQGAGTGLGLATCYGIVRRLGGQVVVESEIAIGSTFHVCLPLAEGQSVEELPAPDADAPSGTETILLVEDHAELRSATQRLLRNRGYQVRTAGSVGEAWELISTMPRRPDLVMSDAQLPDGDGRDLLVALQASLPGLRALLTSGSFGAGELGGSRIPFLQKPYSLRDVAGAVRAVLDGTYQPPGQLS
jgi:CheY-like chemotaxis protein